ncbi:MAG: DUF192 domain-containing protein [Opitutaceae bacterium]
MPDSSEYPSLRHRFVSPLRCLVLFLAPLLVSACDPEPVAKDAWFKLEIGAVAFEVQFAIDQATQARGLMYRESLGDNQGMLFISERPRRQSFWMRNTLIPLDIGFFTEDGTLREVYPMFPRDETKVVSRRDDIFYALEMNHGWFKANGVRTGDRLDTEAIQSARRALMTAR